MAHLYLGKKWLEKGQLPIIKDSEHQHNKESLKHFSLVGKRRLKGKCNRVYKTTNDVEGGMFFSSGTRIQAGGL